MRLPFLAASALALASVTACAQTGTAPAAPATNATGVPNATSLTGTAKTTLPSGVLFESMQAGSGESPKATDTVKVHYRGTLPDCTDSNTTPLGSVVLAVPVRVVALGTPVALVAGGVPVWAQAATLARASTEAAK